MLHSFLNFMCKLLGVFAADDLDEFGRLLVQMAVGIACDKLVQIVGDRSNIFRNRPFIVIENHNEAFGVIGDVVQCFVACSAGKRCVSRDYNNIFPGAFSISCNGHSKCCRKCSSRMPCSITIVFALGPQEKSIQPLILANRIEPVPAAGEKLMNIPLMAYVEDQLVFWGIENPVQRNCELYHTQIRTEMSTGLRENRN